MSAAAILRLENLREQEARLEHRLAEQETAVHATRGDLIGIRHEIDALLRVTSGEPVGDRCAWCIANDITSGCPHEPKFA